MNTNLIIIIYLITAIICYLLLKYITFRKCNNNWALLEYFAFLLCAWFPIFNILATIFWLIRGSYDPDKERDSNEFML